MPKPPSPGVAHPLFSILRNVFKARHPGRNDSTYSRFVMTAKLLLPAVAALLVALVVLWPHFNSSDRKFRMGFTTSKLDAAKESSMINPRFFSADDKGRPFSITADIAHNPLAGDSKVTLEKPKADIGLEDGTWMAVAAATGIYDRTPNTLALNGGVTLFHDSGYEFQTETILVNMAEATATGRDPVVGHGPFGEVSAEGLVVLDKGKVMHFTGKARLLIRPGKLKPEGS
ncbi:MAG: LPS export ABC transporter periplasmic protein LptC [Rhodospirillales bacterium]|nr:LPS export ABC transporter periplasmic protein LptC [Rhodospirillales bacterium]